MAATFQEEEIRLDDSVYDEKNSLNTNVNSVSSESRMCENERMEFINQPFVLRLSTVIKSNNLLPIRSNRILAKRHTAVN